MATQAGQTTLQAVRADHAFDGEAELPGGALVLLREDRIEAVLPKDAPVPPGYRLHDHPGATLLPGLIDTHVHLCGDDGPRALDQLPELDDARIDQIIERALAAQLAAGVTTVRDLGDRTWAVLDRHRTRRAGGAGANSGAGQDTVRPTILASGPPITTVGGHCWYLGGAVAGSAALIRAVAERVERGADVIKVMTSGGMLTPDTDLLACQFTLADLRSVVSHAHAAGLPVTGHAHALGAVQQCLEAGVDQIEHCTCLAPGGYRTPPDLVDRLAQRGTVVCPTMGRAPGVPTEPRIQEQLDRLGITWEGRFPHVELLVRAGVRLVSGADSGIGPTKPHGVLPQAVVDLTLAGATAPHALATATAWAADACGIGDRTGRLRPGLVADLVVVAGDALRQIQAITDPRLIICQGIVVTR